MRFWKTGFMALAIVASVAGIAACGRAYVAPEVTPQLVQIGEAQSPAPTLASLENGRALYTTQCDKCHRLPTPRKWSVDQWQKIIVRMAINARLTDDQRENVLRYVLAVRDLPRPAAK